MAAAALSFYLIHGVVLWFVWTFFGLMQIATNRYFKHRWGLSFWLHRTAGMVVLFVTLIYGCVGYFKLMMVKDDVHAPMGLTVTALILPLIATGIYAYQRRSTAVENQNGIQRAKLAHKIFGYGLLFTSQVTIFWGIYSYTFNRSIETVLHYVSLTLFICLFLILETWHQCFLRKKPITFNEPVNTMSDEEFQMTVQKGQQKLVILDDLVLDVTEFRNSHPGGKFLLDKVNGRDISKYFHGGYSYEPKQGASDHTHSNYARIIVNSLIVARYMGKRDQVWMQVVENTPLLEHSDRGNELPVQVYTLQIRGKPDTRTRSNFYPDLKMAGRHYLVQQRDENGLPTGNARQYTVCNTMEPKLYEAYCNALSGSGDVDAVTRVIKANQAQHHETTLCVKNYNSINSSGLSTAISSQGKTEMFTVSGPMGRRLDVDLNGTNVAFVAGTGALPIMDLIGFIARQTLKVSGVDSQVLGDRFKLTVFGRFRDDEKIGQKLMTALSEANPTQFQYFPGKWEAADPRNCNAKNELVDIQKKSAHKITRIFVCGPPKMNQEFEEMLAQELKDIVQDDELTRPLCYIL